jgi:hypothetical protein
MSELPKGAPKTIRLEPAEEELLLLLSRETGLNKSDLIRRAIKMLLRENQRRPNPGWIIAELGPNPPPNVTYLPGEIKADRAAEVPEPIHKPPPPGKRKAS